MVVKNYVKGFTNAYTVLLTFISIIAIYLKKLGANIDRI